MESQLDLPHLERQGQALMNLQRHSLAVASATARAVSAAGQVVVSSALATPSAAVAVALFHFAVSALAQIVVVATAGFGHFAQVEVDLVLLCFLDDMVYLQGLSLDDGTDEPVFVVEAVAVDVHKDG